jgi:hypothetical protein
MIDWVKIILGLISLAENIFEWAKKQEYIQQGRDEEIARASAAILAKTEYAKNVRTKLEAMDDRGIDDVLAKLDPGWRDGGLPSGG